jgi:hypothetical protein
VGASGKFESGLLPSLRRYYPGALVLERRHQASIYQAYNSMMDEATAMTCLEGLVLVHDDVVFRDGGAEATVRAALVDNVVGLVGAVGGRGQRELSWWTSADRVGHVQHATHDDWFSSGVAEADVVDGLMMAVSPWVVKNIRFDGRGYPGFHGYDGELCSLVRQHGKKVVVADFDIYHDCKPGPWGSPEYGQALLEWRRRWQGAGLSGRLVLRAKRDALAFAASHARLRRLATRGGPRR